jgi:hypothetical protein
MALPDGTLIPPTGQAFDLEFGRPPSGTATDSSSSPPSGRSPCRPNGSASPGRDGRVRHRRSTGGIRHDSPANA